MTNELLFSFSYRFESIQSEWSRLGGCTGSIIVVIFLISIPRNSLCHLVQLKFTQ